MGQRTLGYVELIPRPNRNTTKEDGKSILSELKDLQKGKNLYRVFSSTARHQGTTIEAMATSANPYQNYSQPEVSDHNDDLIDPDNGTSTRCRFNLKHWGSLISNFEDEHRS